MDYKKVGNYDLNRIYLMDCIDGLKNIPSDSIDLIISDPPYNIGQDNKLTKVGEEIMTNMDAWGEWDNYDPFDYELFILKFVSESYRILKQGGGFLYV